MINQIPFFGREQNLGNFRRRAFELCLAIYRVTKLFPAGEVLTKQLREVSSEIVASLATERIRDTILKVETIKIYLAIAKAQNWLRPINFDLLKTAYCLLSDGLNQYRAEEPSKSEKGETRKKIIATSLPPNPALPELSSASPKIKKESPEQKILSELDQRHKIIIDYLNKNQQARVSDLVNFIGDIGERTIRNDLVNLINKNLIKKVGSRKNAKYILI